MVVRALLIVGVILTAAGCLGSTSGRPPGAATTGVLPAAQIVAPTSVKLPITGGTSEERAAVHRILTGMGQVGITGVRLGGPEGGYRQPGLWFYFTATAKSQGWAAMAPEWQAMMVASAYRDLAAATGLPRAGGWALNMHLADGGRVHGAGGSGIIDSHLRSGMFTSAAQVEQRLRVVLRRTGFHVASLRLLKPWHYLPEVTLIATNPKTFTHTYTYSRLQLLGDALVRIQTRCGAPITVDANSSELGWSTSFSDPHWLCPNPQARGPVAPCPARATSGC